MIEQSTITNPRRLLFAIHFPLPYKTTCERVYILESNFETGTEIERGRAGALCPANASRAQALAVEWAKF
jgi:hypothetical protein